MKKLFSILFLGLITITLAACNLQTTQASGKTYMVVDINQSIEFILDEEGNVESYNLLNEDAEIVYAAILEKDQDFLGLSGEAALELFLETAVELGYIDVTRDDNVVLITVVTEDEDEEENQRNRMVRHAEGYFVGHRIGAIVIDSGLTMEEFLEMAEEYDVSPGKLRIALSAVAEDDELTLEAALELSERELMAIIQPAHRARVRAFVEEKVGERMAMAQALREEARERNQNHDNDSANMSRAQIEARVRVRIGEALESNTNIDYRARIEARKQDILDDNTEDTNE
ncbi:MAG: hypothetical protein ACNA7U_00125 [Candidatus Izemoplasmataceae bacterium]